MTNSQLSPAEAATELLKRRTARRQLLHFTNYTFPGYVAEPAHELIGETLDRVVIGDLLRVMIFAPPQHGKSELTSVRLPAYWQGRRPDDPVILASYAASLAERHSREARGIVESDEFGKLFPNITTRDDSRAVNRWQIANHRGGLLAVGVGGPITGHGAKLGIIDDPFENWRQAQSLTIRDQVWDWYRTTFRTRIWEGGAIVLIMTRWHEDDLAGRILQEQADQWFVLRLPALAESQEDRDRNHRRMNLPEGLPDPLGREPDEPLCPRRYSKQELKQLKRDVGTMGWNSEYQAAPTAPEGDKFKRAWFPIVEAGPARARRTRYWDKAGTAGGGKFTAGVKIAVTDDGLIYIEDVKRGQWSSKEREDTIRQTAELDALQHGSQTAVKYYVEQEPGSGGKESAENTIRNLAGFVIEADLPSGDKLVRLEPFAAQAEAGNVRLVRGAWNGAYIEEMCAIPNGTFWDQADSTSGGYNKLTGGKTAAMRQAKRKW